MRGERVILPTDLHNDCGLIAAAAFNYLRRHGVKARVLNIRYGRADGHTIVVFENDGRLCTYDHEGALVFTPGTTWRTHPTKLARAWTKFSRVKKRVTEGKWF